MSTIHIASSPIEDEKGGRQHCRRCGQVLLTHAAGQRSHFFYMYGAVYFEPATIVVQDGDRVYALRATDLPESLHLCLSESQEVNPCL